MYLLRQFICEVLRVNQPLLSRNIKYFMSTMTTHKPQVFATRNDYPGSGYALLKEKCDVDFWPSEKGDIPREEVLKGVVGKDAILLTLKDKADEELIKAAGANLKVISTVSVGVDHIDLKAAKSRSIKVGYTPDLLTEAVAEFTIGLLLTTSRRILEANKSITQNEWKWTPTYMGGKSLAGSTVGIVGFGRIGQSVARKLLPFQVSKLVYCGPRRKSEGDELGANFVSFDELLKQSDFVIVTCPLTKDTKGIFTSEKFSLMKSSAIFINTARGGIVDQDALLSALQNNVIRAAGLDVMTPEPLPPDHPLLKLDNCVLTPHIGSATLETEGEMCLMAVKNILAALEGKDMPAEYKL